MSYSTNDNAAMDAPDGIAGLIRKARVLKQRGTRDYLLDAADFLKAAMDLALEPMK